MSGAVDDLINRVIAREGGYVNHPADRGGPTNWGVTQETLAGWRGRPVSIAEVQALTQDQARQIYRAQYFRGLEAVTGPMLLDFLFDYSVNSGPARAVKCLMVVLGGRELRTIDDQEALLWPALCERFDNFMRIIGRDSSQAVFSTGWANRMVPFWSPAGMPAVADTHRTLTPAEADGILVRGEKGDAIRRLQEKLGILVDGDFGPATERAVVAFQTTRRLIADGVAGPQTLGALGLRLTNPESRRAGASSGASEDFR